MPSPPRRGRPPEADPAEIVRVAVGLFERKGFDRVTMDAIAKASGVSRRTLFRLFPAKSELVWHGLKEVRDEVIRRAAELRRGLPVSEIVADVFTPILKGLEDPGRTEAARRQLSLIAAAPALLQHPTLREIQDAVVAALEKGSLPRGASASLLGSAIVGATFAAMFWWAERGGKSTPLEAATAAWEGLAWVSRRPG